MQSTQTVIPHICFCCNSGWPIPARSSSHPQQQPPSAVLKQEGGPRVHVWVTLPGRTTWLPKRRAALSGKEAGVRRPPQATSRYQNHPPRRRYTTVVSAEVGKESTPCHLCSFGSGCPLTYHFNEWLCAGDDGQYKRANEAERADGASHYTARAF